VTKKDPVPTKEPRLIVQSGKLTLYGESLFQPTKTSNAPNPWTNDVKRIDLTKK